LDCNVEKELGAMRNLKSVTVAVALSLVAMAMAARAQMAKTAGTKLDARSFANPPSEYRPIDCWWWENGYLTKERLRWQLEEMAAKGSGGTWLYPRFGASQPRSSEPGFWTDGWWEFVRFALDEHERLGLVQFANDWLGRLDKAYFQSQLRAESKQRPELVGRRLVAHFARSTSPGPLMLSIPEGETLLSAVAYHLRETQENAVDDETRVDLADLVAGRDIKWDAPGPEWLMVAVCSQPHDLNYLEPAVAKRWIEIFYEPYLKQLGDRLGRSLVAYGPDERSVLGGNILYCDALRVRFEKDKGFDPLTDVAALFIDIGPQTNAIRCQYFDVMNTLLEENLYAPMADWLHEHQMKHVTIATWGRENLLDQTRNYGDFPRMMKYFDIPGNEDSHESGPLGAFIDTKLSSSMAHLNGKNRAAVCAYWGMGWGYTQEENIARTNINYALGINLYNTHGVLYTMLAGRNEWVPPEIHFYQPYWETWRTFTDYVTRLSYALSQGRHRADVALVYPLSTIHASWHNGSKFDSPAADAQTATFALAKTLYSNSLDFDFVDEARLAESEISGPNIRISGLEFPVVVLPSLSTIRGDVLAMLKKFVDAGGTLVVFKQPPTASADAGRDDPDFQHMWQELLGDYAQQTDPIIERRNGAGGRTILVRSSEVDAAQAIRAAIQPDVTTSEPDVLHNHHQIGDQHVYYFVNRRPQPRIIEAKVRAKGRPEMWDARTGKVLPHYEFRSLADGTRLTLKLGPHAGLLVVLQPGPPGSQVVNTNLSHVESIEKRGDLIEVLGTGTSLEKSHVSVLLDGRAYAGRVLVEQPLATIPLDGHWDCSYRLTMNNRWGDFRYPATDEMIGPEAPRVKYRAEAASEKTRLQWEKPDIDDRDWEQVTSTFGPYWQVLGPIATRGDSDGVRQQIVAAKGIALPKIQVDGKAVDWQPYSFSWKLGADRSDIHQSGFEGVGYVPATNLVFDGSRGSQPMVRYLATRVYSPRELVMYFNFGGRDRTPQRQAWVNGEQVLDVKDKPLPSLPKVTLRKGWNQVVLRFVQTGSRPLGTYALFHPQPDPPEPPRYMPLSPWTGIAPELVYDCRGEGEQSIGWYRFQAPPGSKRARLNFVAESVEAWIDGKPVEVRDDAIQFPASDDGGTPARQVALRVHQKPGCYEGAAFTAPIAFECGRGRIPLGDWSDYGLSFYSGGLRYSYKWKLTDVQSSHKVYLDLGDVRTSAEVKVNGKPVGVRLARPFVFDVSDAMQAGDNDIEVEVLNTLANFMSAGPTKFVYKGQTVSGLLGPVKLQIVPQVRIECRPANDAATPANGATE
jgi:hypothetical protein